MNHILLVDDEPKMRELVKIYLERESYKVSEAGDGEEALKLISQNNFSLIVLDIMMPKIDGLTVCKEIRKTSDIPVIMLTAKGEEIDTVLGLEIGADDYIVKPFSPRELVARVKAMLRRVNSQASAKEEAVMRFGVLSINVEAREVSVNGQKVVMTPKEFELLTFLARNPGRVYTREQLLEYVWGYDFFGDVRTVDTHVKKIREKLSHYTDETVASFVSTVWGVGYKFEVQK